MSAGVSTSAHACEGQPLIVANCLNDSCFSCVSDPAECQACVTVRAHVFRFVFSIKCVCACVHVETYDMMCNLLITHV